MEDLPQSAALCTTGNDVQRIVKIIVQLIIDFEEIDGVWNDEDVGMLGGWDVEEAINNMNFDKCSKLVKMSDR